MSKIFITIWCTFAVFAINSHGNPIGKSDDGLTLRIVHTNDMHARFEETSRLSTVCTPEDSKEGKCYGGFARIATLVREVRNSSVPSLFLNAGDTYQGSVWYNVYKWKIVSQFLNILAPDAISLGNHEFDDGVDGLIPFIEKAEFPIVTANLDLSQQPNLAATKLLNSTILMVNGTKVGIIGYLTPETKIIANTEHVIFKDEVESIRREVKLLKKQGVDILIAVGHSGFEVDKQIAAEVEGIDLVIGGHTNTFLYTGKRPDIEVPEGLYPTEIVQKSGRKVYVVQAYAYTKYLGSFTVKFDRKGEVVDIKGNPILVDSSVKQAEDVLDVLNEARKEVENLSQVVVGKTRVLLDGDSKNCRHKECNLGNLVADAMIDYNAGEYAGKDGWTDAAIAVQNSGSIRTSIERKENDEVTMGDILGSLPFHNTIIKVSMTGEQILSMLEWSVNRLEGNSTANLFGAFLQFSGVQVIYDLSKPPNSRVVSVQLRCAACRVPTYNELKEDETYTVLINDFLHGGGDGFSMLMDLKANPMGATTADALVDYFKKHSPIYPNVEWRISYLNNVHIEQEESTNAARRPTAYGALILLPLLKSVLAR